MEVNTHLLISSSLVGSAVELKPGYAMAQLEASAEMASDDKGLVHGGFTFGLADYAAMLAVNDPNVVLGASECKFLAPVVVGETLTAEAEILSENGKKREVRCLVKTDRTVFEGVFTCFVLEKHLLDK